MTTTSSKDINLEKATFKVIKYLEKIYGNLGLLSFRLENVGPNTKKDIWIVDCNFYPSMGSNERVYYSVHVNVKDGTILSAKEINK